MLRACSGRYDEVIFGNRKNQNLTSADPVHSDLGSYAIESVANNFFTSPIIDEETCAHTSGSSGFKNVVVPLRAQKTTVVVSDDRPRTSAHIDGFSVSKSSTLPLREREHMRRFGVTSKFKYRTNRIKFIIVYWHQSL
jgi:hypothetical protein